MSRLAALAPVLAALALASPAAALEPRLEIIRPGSRDPRLLFEAAWRGRREEIPLAGAPLTVLGPEGLALALKTDLRGRARLDPARLVLSLKGRPDELTLTGRVAKEGKSVERRITLTRAEMRGYYRSAAEAMNEEGKERARGGDLEGALAAFREAARLDPSLPRSYYNAGLAAERLGLLYSALEAYTRYLGTGAERPEERVGIKRKAIGLARRLTPPPAVPPQVRRILEVAKAHAAEGRYRESLYGYEQAQVLAPWWPEPYYSAGLVHELLAYRADFHHHESAARSLRLFLEAAPEDARADDARARAEKLERLAAALRLPPLRERRPAAP